MKRFCYHNGKVIPEEKATVSIKDIGILRGFGVFDFMKCYKGKPFLLKEHLQRFENSAKTIGLKIPHSRKELETIIVNLLKKNKAQDESVRIVLTGGTMQGGIGYDKEKPTLFVTVEGPFQKDESMYKRGAKLITYEHQRMFPTAKTTNYILAVTLQALRAKQKAVEILYTSGGKVLEGTTSNFFIFKGDRLITPRENILIGMTRNHVLGLAEKAGFTIEERDIMLGELKEADEACVTASNKEVLPIVVIDDHKIGDGTVGPRVKTLMNLFQDSIQNYVKHD